MDRTFSLLVVQSSHGMGVAKISNLPHNLDPAGRPRVISHVIVHRFGIVPPPPSDASFLKASWFLLLSQSQKGSFRSIRGTSDLSKSRRSCSRSVVVDQRVDVTL
jgi:hypothetical protein